MRGTNMRSAHLLYQFALPICPIVELPTAVSAKRNRELPTPGHEPAAPYILVAFHFEHRLPVGDATLRHSLSSPLPWWASLRAHRGFHWLIEPHTTNLHRSGVHDEQQTS